MKPVHAHHCALTARGKAAHARMHRRGESKHCNMAPEGTLEKTAFAFSNCSNVERSGHSSIEKQKIALEADGLSLKLDYAASDEAVVVKGSRTALGFALLLAEKKSALREECQSAWDKAFVVVCGISFSAENNCDFRTAIEKTRAIPDFKLACAATMSTTRLDQYSVVADR